jgi:hypothetical protein
MKSPVKVRQLIKVLVEDVKTLNNYVGIFFGEKESDEKISKSTSNLSINNDNKKIENKNRFEQTITKDVMKLFNKKTLVFCIKQVILILIKKVNF